jgi:hypothetical protein
MAEERGVTTDERLVMREEMAVVAVPEAMAGRGMVQRHRPKLMSAMVAKSVSGMLAEGVSVPARTPIAAMAAVESACRPSHAGDAASTAPEAAAEADALGQRIDRHEQRRGDQEAEPQQASVHRRTPRR